MDIFLLSISSAPSLCQCLTHRQHLHTSLTLMDFPQSVSPAQSTGQGPPLKVRPCPPPLYRTRPPPPQTCPLAINMEVGPGEAGQDSESVNLTRTVFQVVVPHKETISQQFSSFLKLPEILCLLSL